LRNVLYVFGKFSDQDIDWLKDAGTREDVQAGQVLINEGTQVEMLYLTLAGTFEVSVGGRAVAAIGPGEIIGELSFLDNRLAAATVRAAEPCVCLAFSMKRVRTKLKLEAGFASRFYFALATMLADRTRATMRLLSPASRRNSLEQGVEADGEIPAEMLNDANLAAMRFDRMRRAVLET
jgi:CRP/FNR family transcriptional regulator, cyclic AMP receptor protein